MKLYAGLHFRIADWSINFSRNNEGLLKKGVVSNSITTFCLLTNELLFVAINSGLVLVTMLKSGGVNC